MPSATLTRLESLLAARRLDSTLLGVRPGSDPGLTPFGRLTYSDNQGAHRFDIVTDQITVGRGGKAFPVDIKLATSDDVSREHARIRRDPATGQFYLIDLSTLGTTLNGRHVPRGKDNGAETALPAKARIGLADTVFIDFEQVGQ